MCVVVNGIMAFASLVSVVSYLKKEQEFSYSSIKNEKHKKKQ